MYGIAEFFRERRRRNVCGMLFRFLPRIWHNYRRGFRGEIFSLFFPTVHTPGTERKVAKVRINQDVGMGE